MGKHHKAYNWEICSSIGSLERNGSIIGREKRHNNYVSACTGLLAGTWNNSILGIQLSLKCQ